MITEDDLRAAAASIDQAPAILTQRRLALFRQACRARSGREALRDRMDMDSCVDANDKDMVDYETAEAALADGDLVMAAEWFRKAAENDFSDSALRLARVYEAIADKHLARPGRTKASPDELHFVVEASNWYLAAYAAGVIELEEAGELVQQVLTRHDPTGTSPRPALKVVSAATEANGGEHRAVPHPKAGPGRILDPQPSR